MTVMLKNKIMAMNPSDEGGERLLCMADPERFIEGREVNMQIDVPALSLYDGRELWVLKFNLELWHYIDDFCLSTMDGSLEEKTKLTTYDCTNPKAGKWVVHRNHLAGEYAIFNTGDRNMVVTMVPDDTMNTPSTAMTTWASDTVNDSVHHPPRTIELNDDCWFSDPGVKEVEFKWTFPWYTSINQVKIDFCYAPGPWEMNF